MKEFFEGWYFKCSNAHETVAFIPALHRSGGRQTASLQIITETGSLCLPVSRFIYNRRRPAFITEHGSFSRDGIKLHLRTPHFCAKGEVRFGAPSPLRYDIMGPFSLVPLMECRHSVCSMTHTVNGSMALDGRKVAFSGGLGYIEGDRGHSFPRRYLWTQCHFDRGSLMLSAADIPFCGMSFTGVIGVVLLDGREYRIATYLGAKVEHIGDGDICVSQGDYQLYARLLERRARPLRAPQNGRMERIIHESPSCRAQYCFTWRGKILCAFVSDMASFESELGTERLHLSSPHESSLAKVKKPLI